jgi:hypothetical protein
MFLELQKKRKFFTLFSLRSGTCHPAIPGIHNRSRRRTGLFGGLYIRRAVPGDNSVPGGLISPPARLICKVLICRHPNSHPMAIRCLGLPEILSHVAHGAGRLRIWRGVPLLRSSMWLRPYTFEGSIGRWKLVDTNYEKSGLNGARG